jgi:sulfur carrier protein ThiS adenylyltransferase
MNFAQISEHLSHFRVGIAGAGGLGSNCAVSLARCGIGTLVIADFDVVEQNNLNRQYFFTDQIGVMKVTALKNNIFRINPQVSVIVHQKKLDETNIAEIFQGCDVVVEAFDNSENKELLIETLDRCMPLIPLVIASGLAGWGNNDALKFRKIDETLFVCGDESSEISEEMPPMAPRVGIVANMQANAVVEILMQK